eukprot:SAG22_NODE_755_length_7442_cov_2.270598_5_plen_278_part_00
MAARADLAAALELRSHNAGGRGSQNDDRPEILWWRGQCNRVLCDVLAATADLQTAAALGHPQAGKELQDYAARLARCTKVCIQGSSWEADALSFQIVTILTEFGGGGGRGAGAGALDPFLSTHEGRVAVTGGGGGGGGGGSGGGARDADPKGPNRWRTVAASQRYSAFRALHQQLAVRLQSGGGGGLAGWMRGEAGRAVLPPMPPKILSLGGKLTPAKVEARRAQLEALLKQLLEIPAVLLQPAFWIFLGVSEIAAWPEQEEEPRPSPTAPARPPGY